MRATLLGHLSIGVADLPRGIAFYDAIFAALGGVRCFTGPVSVGYGPTYYAAFVIDPDGHRLEAVHQ